MRVCLYARVSSEEQVRNGYSLAAQIEALRKYAAEHEYTVIGEFVDEGISARKTYKARPALMRMLKEVEADRVDLILFLKLDRWFRNVQAYYQVQPILDAHNVAWKAIAEDYETESASGRFKVNIMLSVAQDEADRTSERIRFVFDDKKSRGEAITGSVGMGFKNVDKHTVVDEETMPIVRDLFQYFIDNRSLTDTRTYLEETYDIHYSYSGVKKILRRQSYIDYVGRDTFVRVQELLNSASTRRPIPKYVYLFSGLIYCHDCGARMVGNSRGERDVIYYFCGRHHQYHDKYCTNKKYYKETEIESYALDHILESIQDHNYRVKHSTHTDIDENKIKHQMEKLTNLYLEDLISKDVYTAQYRALQKTLETALLAPQTVSVESFESVLEKYHQLTKASQKAVWGRILRRVECDKDGNIFLII